MKEKLKMVDLSVDIFDQKPAELSGGMKKRVGVARALVGNPKYIFYDEPTTGLDPVTSEQIDDLVLDLANRFKVTSIVITHDIFSVYKVANNVILLNSISVANSCNLTLPQANTIYDNIANVINLMDTRKAHDENFYTNSKTLMEDFSKVRQFSSMGQSQTALITNYIGTDKIITRIST